MRLKSLLLVVGTLALAACTHTLPIAGQVQGSPESFTGYGVGHLDHAGEITIRTSTGASCRGTFVYVNGRQGQGTFMCDDGRSGAFSFVSTGFRGTGEGTLGGERFIFTFG